MTTTSHPKAYTLPDSFEVRQSLMTAPANIDDSKEIDRIEERD